MTMHRLFSLRPLLLVLLVLGTSSATIGCGPDEKPTRPGAIEGTVTLSDSDDASGVTVRVADLSTQTAADGTYVLAGVAPGEVTLTAQKDGYKPHSQKVTVSDSATKTIDFTLERKNLAPTFESVTLNPEQLEPGGQATLTVKASDPNGDELSFSYEASGDFTAEAGDDGTTATITAPDTTGTVGTVTVTADDGNGQTVSTTLTVETADNAGPRIENLQATPRQLAPGASAVLQVSASDPDEDKLTYKWEAPEAWTLTNTDQLQTQLTAPDSFDSSAEVTVTVTDPLGESDSATLTIRTKTNEGPMITAVEAQPPQVAPGGTIALKVEARDPEGKPLSINWSGPAAWNFDSTQKKITRVTAPDAYGKTATLSVTATDSEMEEAVGTVIVSTRENNGPVISELNVQPTLVAKGGEVVASVNASDPNGDPLSYTWSIAQPWTIKGGENAAQAAIQAPDKPMVNGVLKITVSDDSGKTSVATKTLATKTNRPPTIGQLVASQTRIKKDGSTDLAASASDPDGDTLTYNWEITPSSDWSINGTGPNVSVDAPDAYGKSATVKLTVSDGYGGMASSQLFLHTVDNATPTISSLLANPKLVSRTGTIQAEAIASDPNGDTLSYSWTVSSKDKWTVKGNGAKATVTPANVPSSTATLKVTVTDGNGGSNTAGTIVETKANIPPTIDTPPADLQTSDPANPSPISHSRYFDYKIDASDTEGDPLGFSIRGAPGAKIDSKGNISWRPTRAQQGSTYTAVVEVSDGFDTVSRKIDLKVGAYSFQATNPTTMQEPDGMAFGDFDGDGRTDIVRLDDRGDHSADIEVALGTKNGFSIHKNFTWDSNARNCASPAAGDLDGDKDLDLLVVCDRGRSGDDNDFSYYVWKNDGKANFSKGERHYWNITNGHWVGDVELGDLDGDGDLDAAAVGYEVVLVAPNDGSGRFRGTRSYNRSGCWDQYQVEIAQMRKGGNPELVVSGRDRCTGWRNRYEEGRMQVWDVNGANNLGGRIENRDKGGGTQYMYALGVADLDGDGDNDVVTLDDDSNDIIIFRGDNNGSLRQVDRDNFTNPPHYRQSTGVQFADMDGDGKMDIISGSRSNRRIAIWFTDGNLHATRRRDTYLPSNQYGGDVYGVYVEDWDQNGDPDVIFAESGGKVGIAY